MKSAEKYYLGLDIGTDSVGYAVTDTQYALKKFHGDAAWGVTLFDEPAQGAERRAFRTARRRLDRRQQRVKLLQELFAPAIAEVDPRFFIRQAESALYPADKQEKDSLFHDVNFTDRDYHRRYPTIHHLIHELMVSDEKHDVRLVYQACAWLVAHRGHFLSPIDPKNVAEVTSFRHVYQEFRNYLMDHNHAIPWSEDRLDALEDAMRRSYGVEKKYRLLIAACFPDGKPHKPAPAREEAVESNALNAFPYDCSVLFKGLAGGKIEPKKLFADEGYANIDSFSLSDDEEALAGKCAELGDDGELIVHMKALYDWGLLANVLGGETTISQAKIAEYDQHQADLRLLKRIVRTYCPKGTYTKVFRSTTESKNYVAYSYHGIDEKVKCKCTQEDFCKYILSVLETVAPVDDDAERFAEMKGRLLNHTFMPKQKTGENRVIPYQLYWHELHCLLEKAKGYLPFLAEQDESGLSVSEKIEKVFRFRVPYFVGPLGGLNEEPNHWAVKKEPGRITPWNFEAMVDQDASEQEFIRRMTNTCTYLPGEPALPKDSLLYHRFTVLNEINNIAVNGVRLTVQQKQDIYRDLFEKHPKVRLEQIRRYMICNKMMTSEDKLTGLDETVKSNLKPWHDLRRLLESKALTEQDAEAIIERRSYAEDTDRFRVWLEKNHSALPREDIQYLCRLSYKDFGRLSRRFLAEMEGVCEETGEITTIIQALWTTNYNLMELLSDRYTFGDAVKKTREDYYSEHPRNLKDRLEEMYIPSAVRRSVYRTLDIVGDVSKAFGGAPERIFVEMTRGGKPEQKGQRTQSRLTQLTKLYEKCKEEDVRLLRQQLEAMGDAAETRLQSRKLFLYYLQLGKCAYTGKPIDLDELMSGSSYNLDHIYPQSLVKDDSLLNNMVLVISVENERKSDGLVLPDVQATMRGTWTYWKSCELMTEEKFRRLTRSTPFTSDEKWGFISRQLTETSQSAKAVTELLKELYPDTEIVYVKAQLASEFRQAFDRLKSRDYNDLHHAKDAYLNVVVGNVHYEMFTRPFALHRFHADQGYNLKPETIYTHAQYSPLDRSTVVWNGKPMLETVKRTMERDTAHITRYAYRKQGGMFDQQPVKHSSGLIPLKKGLDTERYGGYNKPAISFFVLVKYTAGKKSDVLFLPVRLLDAQRYLSDPDFQDKYARARISEIRNKQADSVTFPLGERIIKINTMLSLDGYRCCITGNSSEGKVICLSGQMPFTAGYATERYLKRLRTFVDKSGRNTHYQFDTQADEVSPEENLKLYRLYIEKLKKTVYSKRPNHPLQTLANGEDTFKDALSVIEQAKMLLEIHSVFGRLNNGVDLSKIKGAKTAATSRLSASLSNWRDNYHDVRIIDQSPSGLWETRSVNLLDLL